MACSGSISGSRQCREDRPEKRSCHATVNCPSVELDKAQEATKTAQPGPTASWEALGLASGLFCTWADLSMHPAPALQ